MDRKEIYDDTSITPLIDTLVIDDCSTLVKILLKYERFDLGEIYKLAEKKNGEGFYFDKTHYRLINFDACKVINFVSQNCAERKQRVIDELVKLVKPHS